jgi:hypothetical protein
MDQIKPADLNSIANLTRGAIAQQLLAAELKAQGEERGEEREGERIALASLPMLLSCRGGDDERGISVSLTALDRAPAAGIQPASHRGSPRIAADPCGSRPLATKPLFLLLLHRSPESSAGATTPTSLWLTALSRFLQRSPAGTREHRQTIAPIASPWRLSPGLLLCC